MNNDTNNKRPQEIEDFWRLPEIVSMEVVHVRHRTPAKVYVGPKWAESNETVEFLVRTSEDFPIRALSPALFIGSHAVTEGNRVANNFYRFIVPATEIPKLQQDATISGGWAGVDAKPVATQHRFRIHREESR